MMPFTIFLASDHAGFTHKNEVRDWLIGEGLMVEDCGAMTADPQDDYPDFISKAGRAVSAEPLTTKAIIFGGSGQGEAMLANRYRNVRAAVYYGGNKEIVTLSREHNNANILSIGARFVSIDETKEVIWTWLHTEPLPDPKYSRRITKMKSITEALHHALTKKI
jgi:ribose 5-phosphate isomerase B